jgi:phosphate transport system protein
MAGYREEFGRALDAIEAKVIELFAMIAEDLPRATAALLSGDAEVLTTLAERQRQIDAWYPQVEEMVSREILRQAPVASDLRFLLSVLRVTRDFERAHCSVVKIAARAEHGLSAGLSPVTIELTLVARSYERLGDHAVNVAGRVVYLAGSVSN